MSGMVKDTDGSGPSDFIFDQSPFQPKSKCLDLRYQKFLFGLWAFFLNFETAKKTLIFVFDKR